MSHTHTEKSWEKKKTNSLKSFPAFVQVQNDENQCLFISILTTWHNLTVTRKSSMRYNDWRNLFEEAHRVSIQPRVILLCDWERALAKQSKNEVKGQSKSSKMICLCVLCVRVSGRAWYGFLVIYCIDINSLCKRQSKVRAIRWSSDKTQFRFELKWTNHINVVKTYRFGRAKKNKAKREKSIETSWSNSR